MSPFVIRSLVAASAVVAAGTVQADVCSNLQGQYVASGGTGSSRGAVDVAALSNSLAIARQSAQANNCNGGFGFFGPRPSPACPLIMQEVNRLQGQIQASYAANSSRPSGGGLFGGGMFSYAPPQSARDQLRDALVANGCSIPGSGGGGGGGGYKTLCVRTCDGYYFPVGYGVSRTQFDADAQSCQTMYGGAGQAQLFVMASDGDVADATPLSGGKPYSAQPYAFAYRKSYSEACVAQLQSGVASLEQVAVLSVPANASTPAVGGVSTVPLPPIPQRRPVLRFEDPETVANAAGHLVPPSTTAVAGESRSPTGVRVVGAGYYNLILSQNTPLSGQLPVDTVMPIAAPARLPTAVAVSR